MASTIFTYRDAIIAAREALSDAAERTWPAEDVLEIWVPRVLVQLRSDRADAFIGSLSDSSLLEPTDLDAYLPFADILYNVFVEKLAAAILSGEAESVDSGQARFADGRGERAQGSD